MTDDETECVWRLDQELRVRAVGAAWDRFAAENGAPTLDADHVVGRPWLSCVADATTRSLYLRLFSRVRESGEPVTVPIRCDAPDRRRWLDLTIAPDRDAGLCLESRVRLVEPRPPVALLDVRVPRSEETLRICGWCKRVELDGRWVEVEQAAEDGRLLESEVLPQLEHATCPACEVAVAARTAPPLARAG